VAVEERERERDKERDKRKVCLNIFCVVIKLIDPLRSG